jgi:hypothetical protein
MNKDIEKEEDTEKHLLDKLPVGAFIALYSRFMSLDYQEADSFDDANIILQSGSYNGDCMPIAIIDVDTNKMVWFEEYIGKEECQEKVNEFLYQHCP